MKKCFFVFLFCLSSLGLHAQDGSVVLIHGFVTTHRSMTPMERALENLCLDLYSWDYPSRNNTIHQNAHSLVCFLNEIAACSPEKPIHFVAHSIGGWILRAALNHPDCPEEAKVGRAVLIATPNRGCSLARRFKHILPISMFMGDDAGWELRNYTECDVINLGNFPEEMQVLVIAGCKGPLKCWYNEPNDGYILVDETTLNTPYYVRIFNATHGRLLKNRSVKSLVRSFIFLGFSEGEEADYQTDPS